MKSNRRKKLRRNPVATPAHADPRAKSEAAPPWTTSARSRAGASGPQHRANGTAAPAAMMPAPSGDSSDTAKQTARQQFARWSRSYDRSFLNELVFFPSIRRCQEEIVRWQAARGPRDFDALDVGCGTGTLLTLLARDGHARRLVGLDFAPEMARLAAEKFAAGPHARKLFAINADAERLPLADASFDVITCCNSFHHYPHQAAVLAGFRRALRPGGLCVVIDGFRDNVIGWVIFDVGVETIEKHVHHASWSEMRQMLEQARFSRITQAKMNVLAPLLVNVAIA